MIACQEKKSHILGYWMNKFVWQAKDKKISAAILLTKTSHNDWACQAAHYYQTICSQNYSTT